MKLVVAIINPFELDDVRRALVALQIPGMTVTEVMGCGRPKDRKDVRRGGAGALLPGLLSNVKIELAVDDDLVDAVIRTLRNAGNERRICYGKLFVHDLCGSVRIRNQESMCVAL